MPQPVPNQRARDAKLVKNPLRRPLIPCKRRPQQRRRGSPEERRALRARVCRPPRGAGGDLGSRARAPLSSGDERGGGEKRWEQPAVFLRGPAAQSSPVRAVQFERRPSPGRPSPGRSHRKAWARRGRRRTRSSEWEARRPDCRAGLSLVFRRLHTAASSAARPAPGLPRRPPPPRRAGGIQEGAEERGGARPPRLSRQYMILQPINCAGVASVRSAMSRGVIRAKQVSLPTSPDPRGQGGVGGTARDPGKRQGAAGPGPLRPLLSRAPPRRSGMASASSPELPANWGREGRPFHRKNREGLAPHGRGDSIRGSGGLIGVFCRCGAWPPMLCGGGNDPAGRAAAAPKRVVVRYAAWRGPRAHVSSAAEPPEAPAWHCNQGESGA